MLLSLFMSDDIATLLVAFARPKASRRHPSSSFSAVRGRTSVTRSGVNTSCKMRSAGVILLLPDPRLPQRQNETGRSARAQAESSDDTISYKRQHFSDISGAIRCVTIGERERNMLFVIKRFRASACCHDIRIEMRNYSILDSLSKSYTYQSDFYDFVRNNL